MGRKKGWEGAKSCKRRLCYLVKGKDEQGTDVLLEYEYESSEKYKKTKKQKQETGYSRGLKEDKSQEKRKQLRARGM